MYNYYLNLLKENENISFLDKYLEVDSFKRIKEIGYFCGMDYASKDIYNFKEKISRADHSLTVALLVWKLTKDKTSTLAGLFHDIGTPCFSHVIDYMNKDYENQESTEEFTETILTNDIYFRKCCNIDKVNYKDIIDFKKYTIVDLNRPKLCADRLDGIILTGSFWTKTLTQENIKDIVSDLKVYINEDGEKEIGFKSQNIARLVQNVNDDIDKYCHSDEDNYMMELLANITKKAINKGYITYNELYYKKENELFNILENSQDEEILSDLYVFKNIKKEEIMSIDMPFVKKRVINSLVNGKRFN